MKKSLDRIPVTIQHFYPGELDINKNAKLCGDYVGMVISANHEFVPALSHRSGTQQENFGSGSPWLGKEQKTPLAGFPMPYVEKMMGEQHNIFAQDPHGRTIGFMSFIHDLAKVNPSILQHVNIVAHKGQDAIINYLSTLVVDSRLRGHGVATQLYEYLENNLPKDAVANIQSTRTWSTNNSHLPLLAKRGYKLTDTIKNDRYDVKTNSQVDTVYFAKAL